ncbi:Alpha-galactosidase [Apostasia shenzhenica]|uniref:Alpha-galactosidase n=1 Tax=Apostasia shenzhenica TaxID=1088818 RepID=A0A2I0AQH1_9ASPA|nr:Alpha-galactosidase [Apostasia shenzhenica]
MTASALVLLYCALVLFSGLFEAFGRDGIVTTPPRGWNSYDSFSWIVDEEAFLDNANFVSSRLLDFGYEYVVIDFLWYRKNVKGSSLDSYGYDNLDDWGRLVPDPDRWPSSRNGTGFKQIAQKVHDMGLKFGIHVMRGISLEAVNGNKPILDVTTGLPYVEGGRKWQAGDIGMRDMPCAWMQNGFMSVNTDLGAGLAFLRSLYEQYAEWDVDFVKLDCVFGDDLDKDEIIVVSQILEELDRPVLLSLSPGTSVTPYMADPISDYVDMYRITADDWDTWNDVVAHFDVARDFAAAKKIGANGLHGKSWPDLDMLPLGWLTDPGVQQGPHRKCNLNLDEQKTQLTLWSMAKSPLMFGGDLRNIDDTTLNLITNPTLLEINSYSENNMEFPLVFTGNLHRKIDHVSTWSPLWSRKHIDAHEKLVLELTGCFNEKSKGWSIPTDDQDFNQICWNYTSKNIRIGSSCLHKRIPLLTSDEEVIYKQKYEGKFQLLATRSMDACLEPSARRKLTASERLSAFFSTCKWNAIQMWSLNDDGALINSYSGLCATMASPRDTVNSGGARAWVATGRRGEVYLSFFNLNPVNTSISATIGDLAKLLDRKFFASSSCRCYEVWTGNELGVVQGTLSMMVASHGAALFVLNCNI